MKIIFFLFLSLLFIQCSQEKYPEKDFYSESALKSERENFLDKAINQTITESLLLSLNDSTEQNYMSAFWAMQLIQFRNETTDSVIKNSINDFANRTERFQRALLEVISSLYQNEFNEEVEKLLPIIKSPKLFAICVHYLKTYKDIEALKSYTDNFSSKYTIAQDDPILKMLKFDLDNNFRNAVKLPPLIDLFNKDFGSDKIVIYSIQRINRDYPGLLIIKKSDGNFLRYDSGEIFSIPQLARAITDLPGYITNGNTPEGILSIQGIDFSKNVFIGPSPNLQLVLPYEVNPKKYFYGEVMDTIWNKDYYSNLLPDSWKSYLPIFEAYYAGKAGRNEIIAHGTTIDPEFYKGKSYYPSTPSLGCLTTKEIWSDVDGKISESDQLKFINALSKAGSENGFFIVINIDDRNSPIELDEVKEIIRKAENN
jgi:hypothetical protein